MRHIVSQVLARVLGDHHASHGGAARELREMGPRELNDLGIGASEVPFFLEKQPNEDRPHRQKEVIHATSC
ncbi:hypothetical protein [Herbaspirillum sp. C9C3]|uniref:hypothetical protein n=1 Tax=Herbaspirillum sp. C9C3 TaxID=2735271 RepID=UPI0015845A72|nr:hypothetical protein [Herbaspirillum sp. C9C3]NUT63008.1 hypothetical protein [Herbaspirillum sp. C9C3]